MTATECYSADCPGFTLCSLQTAHMMIHMTATETYDAVRGVACNAE